MDRYGLGVVLDDGGGARVGLLESGFTGLQGIYRIGFPLSRE